METINFKHKVFNIVETYHNHKIHAEYKGKDYIIVPFNDATALSVYLSNKKVLKKNKVKMPRILKKDRQGLMVLEEYIPGESLVKVIAENRLSDLYYTELFRVYRQNRFAGIAISYKPEHFIYYKKWFYYLGDFVGNFKQEIVFESSDDILLWLATENAERYVKARGYTFATRKLLKPGGELNKQIALTCVKYW